MLHACLGMYCLGMSEDTLICVCSANQLSVSPHILRMGGAYCCFMPEVDMGSVIMSRLCNRSARGKLALASKSLFLKH